MMETSTYPTEWMGGHVGRKPRLCEKYQYYDGDLICNKKRFRCQFYWKQYGTKQQAYDECEQWLYKTLLENNRIRNRYRYVSESQVEVLLKYKEEQKIGIIDAEDLPLFQRFSWSASQSCKNGPFYACCTVIGSENGQKTRFHRMLHPEWKEIDHINGNGLDNRKSNLRDGSNGVNNNNNTMNSRNRSGENGVAITTRQSGSQYVQFQWYENHVARCKKFSKRKYGSLESAFEAAKRYRDRKYRKIGNHNGKRPKLT